VLAARVPGTSVIPPGPDPERLRALGAAAARISSIELTPSPALPVRSRPIEAEDFAGMRGTRLGGVESTLVAGQEGVAPAGTAHDWWNAGDDDAQVLIEISPLDPRFELMIGQLFGLANAGKTNAKGKPGLLQLALIGRESRT